MALISAHRAAEGGAAALSAVAASGVDHVELDVRRTRDGVFVVVHDDAVQRDGRSVRVRDVDAAELAALTSQPVLTLHECLDVLRGRAGAHVDLKIRSPGTLRDRLGDDLEGTWEVQVVRAVVAALGDDGAVITSGSGASIALLRTWARRTGRPGLPVGLSLGRGVTGLTPREAVRVLRSELFPAPRMAECGANLVVAQKELARATLAGWARRHGVPLLVWTVDSDWQLSYWLAPGRAWMVTTNRPARALEIADQRRTTAASRGAKSANRPL